MGTHSLRAASAGAAAPHSAAVVPDGQRERLCSRLCPRWAEPGWVLFVPSLLVFMGRDEMPLSLPQLHSPSTQPLLPGEVLQSFQPLGGSSLDSHQALLHRESQNWMPRSRYSLINAEQRGMIVSLDLLALLA